MISLFPWEKLGQILANHVASHCRFQGREKEESEILLSHFLNLLFSSDADVLAGGLSPCSGMDEWAGCYRGISENYFPST